MKINVFFDYNVNYTCKYSFINEDGEFAKRKVKQEFNINGGVFLDKISDLMKDNKCIEIESDDNEIYIGHFDPHSGEDADYVFKYKELKKDK